MHSRMSEQLDYIVGTMIKLMCSCHLNMMWYLVTTSYSFNQIHSSRVWDPVGSSGKNGTAIVCPYAYMGRWVPFIDHKLLYMYRGSRLFVHLRQIAVFTDSLCSPVDVHQHSFNRMNDHERNDEG